MAPTAPILGAAALRVARANRAAAHLLRAMRYVLMTSTMSGASVAARSTPVASPQATGIKRRGAEAVDMKLEVVVVPVANVDRPKNFYHGLG